MTAPLHRGAMLATAVACALLCVGVAVPADAQLINGADSTRPYGALFGGAEPRPTGNQSLIVNASLFGGYDDDIFARGDNPSGSPNRPRVSGEFLGGQAQIAYQRRFRNANLSASGATAMRYVLDTQEYVPTFRAGNVSYMSSLSSRTDFMVSQSVAYRPFFTPVVFPATGTVGQSVGPEFEPGSPGDIDVTGPDDFTVASDQDGIRYSTFAQLNRRMSARSGLQFRGQYGLADFSAEDTRGVNNTRWAAGGAYHYDIARPLTARLGYTYRAFRPKGQQQRVAHNINAGLVFNQPFAFQRGRTFFGFTTGSTLVTRERISEDVGDGGRTIFRLVGTANVTHTFSRAWQASVNYAHQVGFWDGFDEPVESDRVIASLGGLLTRSVDVSMSVGYLSGAIGMRERNFDTTLASARIRFALHTNVALFAQYFYYDYLYQDGVADQVLAAPQLERQGVRGGVTVWWPLLR